MTAKACEAIHSAYYPAGAAVCSCVRIAKHTDSNPSLLQMLLPKVAGRHVKVLPLTVLQPVTMS